MGKFPEKLMAHIEKQILAKEEYITFEITTFQKKHIDKIVNKIYNSGYHLICVQDFLTIVREFIFEKDKVN